MFLLESVGLPPQTIGGAAWAKDQPVKVLNQQELDKCQDICQRISAEAARIKIPARSLLTKYVSANQKNIDPSDFDKAIRSQLGEKFCNSAAI